MNSSTAESEGRNKYWLLLLAPALLTLIVFLLIPAGIVLRISFFPGRTTIGAEGYSLAQYVKFFGDSLYLSVLAETVSYALIVCLGCLVLGFPVGYSIARLPPANCRLRMLMVIVPLTLSLVVVVFGWLVLLGRQGLVNNILVSLEIVSSPQQLLFNRTAVVIVLIQQFLPFMILSVMNIVMQIDPVLEQASTSLRANRVRTGHLRRHLVHEHRARSRNKEAALAYINQLLSDQGMLSVPKALRYGPTTDVALGELAADILINSRERVALKRPIDWKAFMEQGPALGERMTKELRG